MTAAFRTLGSLSLFLLVSLVISTEAAQTHVWIQTTQSDFESGHLSNLDSTSSPGDLRLAEFSEFVVGSPSINRSQISTGELFTLILDDASAIIDRSGIVTSFTIFSRNTGGSVQLRIFRDNGTHFNPVASSPAFTVDSVPFRKGVRLSVGANDVFGATFQGVQLAFDDAPTSSRTLNSDSEMSTRKGDWTTYSRTWSLSGQAGIPGTIISSVRDTKGQTSWLAIAWKDSLAGTSAIIFNTRASASGEVWSSWSTDYEVSGQTIVSPDGRFIQYKATFISGSPTDIPSLHEVTISFETPSERTPSSLFLWSNTNVANVGDNIEVAGRLLPSQVAAIRISLIRPDGNVQNSTLVSDTSGTFSSTSEMSASGLWIIIGSWTGDSYYLPALSSPLEIQVRERTLFAFSPTTYNLAALGVGLLALTTSAFALLKLKRRKD